VVVCTIHAFNQSTSTFRLDVNCKVKVTSSRADTTIDQTCWTPDVKMDRIRRNREMGRSGSTSPDVIVDRMRRNTEVGSN